MTFINQTSQDATGLYPGFMYESILKAATQNSDFRFAVRSTPYPPTIRINTREVAEETNTVMFQMAIAYSIVIVAAVVYLVSERMNGLKHLQIISGMQLKAYWIGNFLFDAFKMSLLVITTIILWFAFSMDYNSAWLVVLLCPFGILPFTYFTSFLFTSESGAQTLSMILHIIVLGILPSMIFTFRIGIPTLQNDGDILHGVFKIIPTYMMGSSMFCDKSCENMALARESPFSKGKSLEGDPWAMPNTPFDCLMMLAHLVFWSILIMMIEIGLFKLCRLNPNAKVTIKADDTDVI
jgi:ATP-binding cassette subfamily A (ABC1) protein 3